MKNLLFLIGAVLFCTNPLAQSFGDAMGSFNGVTSYYNPSGHVSNTYNYLNDINTGMKWQCVEYVNRYYLQNYGQNIRIAGQNAVDYYGNAAQRGLDAYPNGGQVAPQIGDILCLSGNTYGHVAIIREVNTSNIKVIQQNSGGADYVNFSFPRSGNTINGTQLGSGYTVQGWLRKAGVSAPNLSAPADNAAFVKGNNITFYWSNVTNASFYEIWIDNASGFGSPEVGFNNGASPSWVSNGIVNANSFTLTVPWQNQLEQNLYYWKVRALDAAKQPLTGWSPQTWKFILYDKPNPPTPNLPINGAEFTKGNNIVFSWSSVANASAYEIWIDNASGFGSPEVGFNNGASSSWVNNGIVSTNNFTLTLPWQNQLEQNLYYWKVRALYADNQPFSDWSTEVRNFVLLNNTSGIDDISENENLILYPNPATNELTIEVKNNTRQISFEIFNLAGQITLRGNFFGKTIIPLNNLTSGVYFIIINDGKSSALRKFIRK